MPTGAMSKMVIPAHAPALVAAGNLGWVQAAIQMFAHSRTQVAWNENVDCGL